MQGAGKYGDYRNCDSARIMMDNLFAHLRDIQDQVGWSGLGCIMLTTRTYHGVHPYWTLNLASDKMLPYVSQVEEIYKLKYTKHN